MKIDRFTVVGFRSIREANLPMGAVNLIVGANGSGKTNLYRSLLLLHAAANGRLAQTIAEEGGMGSALWAGRRRKGPVRVRLGIELETLAYELSFGLPPPDETSAFKLDPSIKTEQAWLLNGRGRVCILDRTNTTATVRDAEGNRALYPHALALGESVLSELREPARFPELAALRQEFGGWRFYHQFRTDEQSPLRRPQIGVRTPVLAHDGSDLVPAMQTILEVGDRDALLASIEQAFPGAVLMMECEGHSFSFGLRMPGVPRPFSQRELSDGTLHYLALAVAMLTPRPPALLAINEPEASLHADLYPALAKLSARAAKSSQLWITTHSEALSKLVEQKTPIKPIRLNKVDGETRIEGHGLLGELEST